MSTAKPPPYVVKYRKVLDRFKSRRQWVIRRFLPAPGLVRTLIAFFKKRIERENWLLRTPFAVQDETWYVEYSPGGYLPIIERDARRRSLVFLIATLRAHQAALSGKTPIKRDWHALDALEAVGEWWTDKRTSYHVPRRDKKALDLCVRIRSYKLAGLRRSQHVLEDLELHTAALKWETRQMQLYLLKDASKGIGSPVRITQ